MTRQLATVAENNFVGGLNTEATPLKFPPNACTDVDNCMLDRRSRMVRRAPFNFEDNSTAAEVDYYSTEVVQEYVWETVASDANTTFLVVQKGKTLHFYDLSSSLDLSSNKKSFTVGLASFLPSGSSLDPGIAPCSFTAGNGNLIVTNPNIEAFYVTYTPDTDAITTTRIVVKYRDFSGVDDTLTLNQRLTATVSGLKSDNPEHYYNLLNQGWHATDALSQWDTARTDMPSNADTVALYRSSETDAFDNTLVTSKGPGNTPAPKGHFILTAGNPDRNTAMTDEGFTGATIGVTAALISQGTGAVFSGGATPPSNPSNAFDGSSGTAITVVGTTSAEGYIGKNYSSAPKRITKVDLFPASGSSIFNGTFGGSPNMTVTLRGSQTAPSSSSDGTSLGSATSLTALNPGTNVTLTVNSSDTTTFWNYVWIVISGTAGAGILATVTEVQFSTVASVEAQATTPLRFSTTAFFAGRIWYGGLNFQSLGSNVYFSQIVQAPEQFAKCYQQNDPTSEDIFDLLPSDGGVIKIPEMGFVTKLLALQTAIIIFANNGIWMIQGASGQSFRANDYQVKHISNQGTKSSSGFIIVKGVPIWWGDEGINTIVYDPSYDSYTVKSLSDQTIRSFFFDIPAENRIYIKGAYDIQSNLIYWLFNDTASLTSDDHYRYNKVLTLDPSTGAYFPWTIGSSSNSESIRGILYAQDASRTNVPVIKYLVTTPVDSDSEDLTFAVTEGDDYLDWGTEDYDSTFVTGYRLDAQAQRYFQMNYVMVYMTPETDASCYMQGIFEWTTDPATGRWSNAQQIFNPNQDDNRVVNHRRLVVRGEGKSAQLRFYSETGKPFTILGWSILESANASV